MELPGTQEYVEIFAKTMEGDVCTADESEGWSPYVEILALSLAGPVGIAGDRGIERRPRKKIKNLIHPFERCIPL